MTVLRFDPFRDLDRMTQELFGVPSGSARSPRFMPMDLYRSGDHFVLHADLPGVDPGSVDVDVDNGVLTIRAERTSRTDDDSVTWLSSERFTGRYMRQLSLGDGIDADRIEATYENGVLTLSIPVAEKAKPRRIEVSHAGRQTAIHGDVQESATVSG